MTTDKSLYGKGRAAALCIAIALVPVISTPPMMAQTESAILKLTAADGAEPSGGLIADSAGNLYGTANVGGVGQYGTVFEVSPPASGGAWTETTLHAFSGAPDGDWPVGPLLMDNSGNLYGVTNYGGEGFPYNYGTVFELSPPVVAGDPWTEAILHTFQGIPDGETPNGGLVMDSAGNLYGTTLWGGACKWGTVFELSPPATSGAVWTEKVLYRFRYTCNGTTYNDAASPMAGLVMDKDGALYGTTYNGGEPYDGTVFKLTPPAAGHTAWTEKILYTFTGGSDGERPVGSLVFNHGKLYGTAAYGANAACTNSLPGCGTIFELSPPSVAGDAWTETTLYSFTGGTDGEAPEGSVLFDEEGNLYATATGGGSTACGTIDASVGCGAVIKLTPPAAAGDSWTETTLYDFIPGGNGAVLPSNVVPGKSGRLYGTTYTGGDGSCSYNGNPGCGVVFAIIP
ncbi:MAG: choice-of-anchor tandem repeat GloVer-containing protein [Candidatus Sulfotelmatobacter sp.]|jgi:uncharacterized repeat protein (TIGR03803 family)